MSNWGPTILSTRRKLVLVYCVIFGITAALVAIPWILALLQ